MDAVIAPYNKEALFGLFTKLEFVKLIDKYGLRGVALKEEPTNVCKCASLPLVSQPDAAGLPAI